MILHAPHSHLYPGLNGTISRLEENAELPTEYACLVEFADGSTTPARISRSGNDWHLCTKAYRTAAGTDIAEKAWRIRLEQDGERIKFRILGKAQGPSTGTRGGGDSY